MTAPTDRPTERQRRSNRLLLGLLATPFAIAAVAGVVAMRGPSEPSVALTPPAGYQAISDAYFAYAIPAGWKQSAAATTANGTFEYTGTGGWVGEVLDLRSTPPALGDAAPSAFGVFGQPAATPFGLVDGHPVTVPGTTTAFAYTLVRGGAPVAQLVDAWSAGSRTEIWLGAHADPAVEATVVGSLRA